MRVRCGFGCAICGVTITEYEHFYPDFSQATIHDPDRIVLLCPTHHGLVTKGVLPKDQVAAASKAPAAKQNGYSHFSHPWFNGIPSLKIGGGGIIQGTPIPIEIGGEQLLKFDLPESGSNVTRISATLRDPTGSQILKIVENEWQVIGASWDFQLIGNRYIFKDSSAKPILIMRMEAPKFIAIELLRTSVNGTQVQITEQNMKIGGLTLSDVVMSNCGVGISFN
ncbi:hypothetical protein WSK_4062 [Novosphingobium sp. Rr 2-17]|uniref:hypothetical protein n=1 Tax=Novosphingobium sp. Rr 2-17 TaxID=555793 RepID=UPI0002699F29|nr:hypothetical protein [Novosphingobium sp. Rr 2-17]EIZ77368.1 hypothetical protein WSK_4062 [Novosphingobium sp. Rr 2-17]